MIEVDLFQFWAGVFIAATGGLLLGRLTVWMSGRNAKRAPAEPQPTEHVGERGKYLTWNGQRWYSEGFMYYKSQERNKALEGRVVELRNRMDRDARKNSVDLAIESGARGSAVVATAGQIYEYLMKENER